MKIAGWRRAGALMLWAAACGDDVTEPNSPSGGTGGDAATGEHPDASHSGGTGGTGGTGGMNARDASPPDAAPDAEPDSGAGDGAMPDPPDAGGELSVRCVSELNAMPSSGAHGQRYRFDVPLDRPARVAIHRGDVNLFTHDEETARNFAATAGETPASAVFERDMLAELKPNGDIAISWDDGDVQLGRLFAWGILQGPGSFAGDEREMLCWRSDLELPHRYDPATGQCASESGIAGRHVFPLLYIHETGNGECNDFGEVEVSTLHSAIYAGWNLRGADLSRAGIHFATMPDADFSGADLSVLNVGYFGAAGKADAHTKLPDGLVPNDDGLISFGDGPIDPANTPPYYAWLHPCAERPLATHCVDLE